MQISDNSLARTNKGFESPDFYPRQIDLLTAWFFVNIIRINKKMKQNVADRNKDVISVFIPK